MVPVKPGTESRHARLAVMTAMVVAVAAGAAVLVFRVANVGFEPDGRNWWIVVEVVLGLGYLPVGAVLTTRGRVALGAAFLLVGGSQATSAVLSEWAALRGSAGSTWAQDVGRTVEVGGLLVLAVIVPLLLPWRGNRDPRDPLNRWLAMGALAACLGATAASFHGIGDLPGANVVAPLLLLATAPLLAVGALIADIRDDATAINVVSHRFLAWAMLVTGIVVVYTTVVAGFGAVLGANGPAWLLVAATGGIAVALEPARSRIRHLVDRLVYGQRDDPLAVIRQLVNQQVATATDVDGLLPALATIIGEALRLDHVAIDLLIAERWSRAAECGAPVHGDEALVLAIGDQTIGRVVVGCHGSSLGRRDREVLADVIPHVTLAVGLVRVTTDLRRSRLAVVTTREEERRRLRRDLHDGLGPSLTGIAMALRTVVRRMQRNEADAANVSLLDRLAAEVDASVGDVKRIVRDLRPTALDDQGLSGALTEFARSFDGVIKVVFALPPAEPKLPAAVEIATYRIATEALTNVVRHANATVCSIGLAVTEHVELDVCDDGIGIESSHPSGVGLAAMRERATELGGTLAVTSVLPHGTRVHASLPLVVG
jgi:two-component system NarL family sensor kinase